jgi:hypothetical protein
MDKIRPRIPANQQKKLRKLDNAVQQAEDRYAAESMKREAPRDANFVKRIKETWRKSKDRVVYCSLGLMHIAKIRTEFVGQGVFLLLPRTSLPDWVESDS